MERHITKEVQIGNRWIGGNHSIAIQSMTNTKTEDVAATVAQIKQLTKVGCEIIRCAVPTQEAAAALTEIKKQITIPLVADIHFDYRLAIAAMEHGADKIRINPGNIGSRERVKAVVDVAKERRIPIRVGVNSGSLEKGLVEKYHGVTAEGIVESAMDKVKLIEDMGYDNLVISIKSSDVMMCVKAHELIAKQTDHPLHVGITEAGTLISGNIKSAIGLGLILNQGIGDTIRVSLTGDPLEEIKSAKLILRTLGLRKGGVEVVSCPTCGRTRIDLIGLANQVETEILGLVQALIHHIQNDQGLRISHSRIGNHSQAQGARARNHHHVLAADLSPVHAVLGAAVGLNEQRVGERHGIRNPVDFGVLGLDPYIFRHAAAEILEKAVHFMGLAHPVAAAFAEFAFTAGNDLIRRDSIANFVSFYIFPYFHDMA